VAAGTSFSVPLHFCTYEQAMAGPGGTGFAMKVSGVSAVQLTAVSPSGAVYEAHFGGTRKGKSQYRECVLPDHTDPGSQVISRAIEPGTWTVNVSNPSTSSQSADVQVFVAMARTSWQETYCPPEDCNF
jgi:hypothetical protein